MNRPTHSTPIDKNTEESYRPAEADELNFDDDLPTPGFGEELGLEDDDPAARDLGLTEASQPGEGPTDDDLTAETLIIEDGARSEYEEEQGLREANDNAFSIVDGNDIGAGGGLDEAELARVDPLDRKKNQNK